MKSNQKGKKNANNPWRWIVQIFVITIIISTVFSFASNIVLERAAVFAAIFVLFFIVILGILFDVIGVAVTAVDAVAIHGMASRRVRGAVQAAVLIKNANKVSSICCDVIGDICGIISGSATAVIAVRMINNRQEGIGETVIPLLLSGAVAALTVSGKAIGKIIAMNNSTQIIFFAGRIMAFFDGIADVFRKKRLKTSKGRNRNKKTDRG